jgi:hypothetical protein
MSGLRIPYCVTVNKSLDWMQLRGPGRRDLSLGLNHSKRGPSSVSQDYRIRKDDKPMNCCILTSLRELSA